MQGKIRSIAWSVFLFLFLIGTSGAAAADQPVVNLFLFETGVREALSELSLQTGVNIIPDETVSGVVTADLEDVPLEKALRIILIGGGYTYRKIDDFYFVGLPDPRSNTFKELVETEIVVLENVTVEKVLGVLPGFLGAYVKGESYSNTLTITASPEELERIKFFIEQIDRPEDLVEIQVLITEVSTHAARELGMDLWEFSLEAGERKKENWQSAFGFVGNLLSLQTNVFGQFLTNLKLLEEKQEAIIHADPKIVVSDGKEARLFVGDRQILLLQGGENVSTRVERVEVGVTLKVIPTVTGAGDVILEISPEISHFMNETKTNFILKESSLTTTIRLASGQTALLAGMTLDESLDSVKKVPILGDIPLLRWLFRTETKRDSDKELLIFVTPIIK
ncbi:MAG: secretin [Firmicutes bacterium]|nr:secretin [Bacillota bacterium]